METKKNAKEVLIEELKKNGLDIAEDAAISAVKAVFKALPPFLIATDNKVDDLLISVLPVVEPFVLEQLDKIDGETDLDS